MSTATQPPSSTVFRVLLVLLAIASLGVTTLILLNVLARPEPIKTEPTKTEPRPRAALPDFQLINQDGQPFGKAELTGKVWVASFMFTRCDGVCPMMVNRIAMLEDDLGELAQNPDVRLVSITVDPERDDPETLRKYMNTFGKDIHQWVFLTGDKEKIWSLSQKGFKLGVGDDPTDAKMPIAHSPRLVLVDKKGRIIDTYKVVNTDRDLTLKEQEAAELAERKRLASALAAALAEK